MDPADRELETCPAGPGLGLSLHLTSLATARHLVNGLKSSEKLYIRKELEPIHCIVYTSGQTRVLLGAGVLGNSLGALGHGMLGKFARKKESDSSLDLPRGDGGPVQ